MATQIKWGPSGEFCVVDDGSSPSFPTLDITNEQIGYDNKVPQASTYGSLNGGTATQAANPYGDTGSTTLDTVNDTVYADPSCATFVGNGGKGVLLNTAPTFATVTKVLTNPLSATILWKNPA